MRIFQKQAPEKQPVAPLPLAELLPAQIFIFNELAVGKPTHSSFQTTNNASKLTDDKPSNKWFAKLIGLPAYYWVLLSQVVVILPHLAYMPLWLVLYALFSIIMQLPRIKAIFARRQKLKGIYRAVQLLAFLLSIGGLWLTYGGFSVDAGVAFLLLCLCSKFWEMYQRRDAFVVLNLSLFVCASLFLLDQGLGSSIQAFFALLCVLMAFVAMNDDAQLDAETGSLTLENTSIRNTQSNSQTTNTQTLGAGRLRSVGTLAGLAVPLLVVLFLFFPRLPPLWSMQMANGQAKTGMSDSMSAGDFANLSQSTELAFRVEFEGQPPSRANMYWRGLVFSNFDGKTWTANTGNTSPWLEGQKKPAWVIQAEESSNQPKQNYKVILEPTMQQWLFALDYPLQISKDISLTPDFTLSAFQPVFQQRRYQSTYKANTKISIELSAYERKINLELPATGNDKTRKLAQQLASQVDSSEAYITAIMQWINQGEFHYTLSPPRLTENRVDQFLFQTQAGFCEHYASSFAFLLRAGGIPARVVVGYQGGQLAQDGKSWEVRQMDAHAWTEVWLNKQGWVRIDPTSWVAPERIERGMTAVTNDQGADMFGDGAMAQLNYQQYKLLQKFRRFTDQIGYYWDRDIVGFDQDKQSSSLFKWFKIKDVMQQIVIMVVVFVVVLTMFVLIMWWRRRQQWHIADKALMKLSQRLAKENEQLAKADNEGMLAWLDRLETVDEYADYLPEIEQVKASYRQLRYGKLSAVALNVNQKSSKKSIKKGNKRDKATAHYQAELAKLNDQVKILIKKL